MLVALGHTQFVLDVRSIASIGVQCHAPFGALRSVFARHKGSACALGTRHGLTVKVLSLDTASQICPLQREHEECDDAEHGAA